MRGTPDLFLTWEQPLLQLLDAQPGELILDLGCGDGALTEKIAGYGCAVIGVDSSFPAT